MRHIVGVLPMAGTGSRLGLPFPKPLAPVLTDEGIVPLYFFALHALREVTTDVVAIVAREHDRCLSRDLLRRGVSPLYKGDERGELPSSLRYAAEQFHDDVLLAVAFPDSIFPAGSMGRLANTVQASVQAGLGGLGLFLGDCRVLDEVSLVRDEIVPHCREDCAFPEEQRMGWGILVAEARLLLNLSDEEPLGPQLGRLPLARISLAGRYVDLGTPGRYMQFHDLRTAGQMGADIAAR